jgi:hypothetical protein
MEDMADVNFNDTAELNMPFVSEVNVDDLIADVAEVQTILQCNNIGQKIDVNEIYEKLEELTYIRREHRIEYVATQLLHKLGVIVEQDVPPEDRAFRFSVQSEDSVIEDARWPLERVGVREVPGSGGTRSESSILYSNAISVDPCDNYITEPAYDFCQNFMGVPAPDAIFPDTLLSTQSSTEHNDLEEIQSDFCRDAETLLDEAKLICGILPHDEFEQIYACLEAIRDCDIRSDVATDAFLKTDAESGVALLPCTDSVDAFPSSAYAPSVDNVATCRNQTASHDEKRRPVERSVSDSPTLQQNVSAGADLEGRNCSGSVRRDEERGWGVGANVDINIENAHTIVTGMLRIVADDDEGEESKEYDDTQPSSEQEATRPPPEQEVNKENDGALFAEQKISKDGLEMMPLSCEQKDNGEGVEMTPLSLDNGGEVTEEIQEESSELPPSLSCGNIVELSASENGYEVIDLTISDEEEEDTLSYNSCEDLDIITANSKLKNRMCGNDGSSGSHPSCNVPEIMGSQNLTETSSLCSGSQDVTIVHCTGSDVRDPGNVISDSETVHRESDIPATERLENTCNCDEPTNVITEEEDCGSPWVAETEDRSDASVDLITFQDSVGDIIVSKLCELFPDVSIDFLTEISRQFDSLTDMVNRVLECIEEAEEGDGGDTASSVNAAVPEPPSQGCRKKEITYEQFVSSLPHADPGFLMKTWATIGSDYNAVKEFIAEQTQHTTSNNQYHMLLSLFPHADPTFLREKCNAIGSNEAALKDFIEEQSRCKADPQYHMLLAMFPQADSGYLRMKCFEIGDDEEAMREFIAEQLKKNEGDDRYHSLVAMFPDADPAFLRENARTIGDDEDSMRMFVTQQLDEVDSVKFETLLAVLPDADPEYLRATFDKIGNDEESIKVFLLESVESKGYPTREEFLKRQEMAALRRKYNEEFSIEDFIEIFPEPFSHFCENKRGSSQAERDHGVAYLEKRYWTIPLNDVRMSFQRNNHNLTLTCEELDEWRGPPRSSSDAFAYTEPPIDNLPVSFLQEVSAVCLFLLQQYRSGPRCSVVVEALCYKPGGRGFKAR